MSAVRDGNEDSEEALRRAFKDRWRNLEKRSEKEGLKMPDMDRLWKKVRECWESGFRCEYCDRKMMIKDKLRLRSFSLEHKESLSNGGDNSLENFAIACGKCNTAKGSLDAETFRQLLNGNKITPSGLSLNVKEFFELTDDGWGSAYESIDKLLKHLARKSRSESSRNTYLQQIKSLCSSTGKTPDELVDFPKQRIESLVQEQADEYNTSEYSRKTANKVLNSLKAFFKANGFKDSEALDVEGFYTPTRYRKTEERIPRKHEVYRMADASGSPRDRAIILTLYSSGLRNSTLRALRYKDVKDELLQGIPNFKLPVYQEMKQVVSGACKYNLPHYTFVCDEAAKSIRLYLQERVDKYGEIEDEDPLFASEYNQVCREVRSSKFLSSRQLRNIVKSAAELSGISEWEDVKVQSFRKAFETVVRSKTVKGDKLDPKVQEFLMGHTLPGSSQDNYFDPTRVEQIRADYSTLKFGRVVVENKFKRLRRAAAEAFEGTEEDPDEVIEEYIQRKKRLEKSLKGNNS